MRCCRPTALPMIRHHTQNRNEIYCTLSSSAITETAREHQYALAARACDTRPRWCPAGSHGYLGSSGRDRLPACVGEDPECSSMPPPSHPDLSRHGRSLRPSMEAGKALIFLSSLGRHLGNLTGAPRDGAFELRVFAVAEGRLHPLPGLRRRSRTGPACRRRRPIARVVSAARTRLCAQSRP